LSRGWVGFGVALLCWAAQVAAAQGRDPNAALANEVIVAQLPGRSIAALVTHQPGAARFTHAIALFPGSPGYIDLRVEGGEPRFGLRGNFLIRARRHFIEESFLTAVIDAPSDEQGTFYHAFRETARYGEDIRAVVEAISRRFAVSDWTFIGTSEGSVSAAHAARMLPSEAKRVVLTASVVNPSGRGRGVEVNDIRQIRIPVLWVHHRNDPCKFTPYSRVRHYAEETKTALLTVTGAGEVRGGPCEAFSEHGFVGMEVKTIKAILSWIRTGTVPPDVTQ
jgi:pimeloyl-ACP methyl ester carboxylesterase